MAHSPLPTNAGPGVSENAGRTRVDGAFVLLLLLLAGQALIQLRHASRPLVADEFYWTAKAGFIAEHRAIPPVDPRAMAAERGEAWGNSDWRPQGYSLFLALVSGGEFERPESILRFRSTLAQILLLASLLLAIYAICVRSGVTGRARYLAAAILGISPWPFEFIVEIGADTLNAIVMTAAVLLLWRWAVSQRTAVLVAGAVLASSTLLIRPEMIVNAPLVAGAALVIGRSRKAAGWFLVAAAFAAVVGLQVIYRTIVTGQAGIYGGQHIPNKGAFHWAETWLGTEKEGYDFVYALGSGTEPVLPGRAFGDDSEKQTVDRILGNIRRRGAYAAEDDAAFEALARKRHRDQPLLMIVIRVWHSLHIWLNTENPTPWLMDLSHLSRAARRPILAGLVALRLTVYALALWASIRSLRRWRAGMDDVWDRLTLLCAALILSRSILVGLVLNWKVHRYAVVAWPAMLWCACAALREMRFGAWIGTARQ